MTTNEKVTSLFARDNGILKMAKTMENGAPESAFYAYVKEHGTERMIQRVYLSPDAWTGIMYLLHLRYNRAVFPHENALFFRDLIGRELRLYSVTVETGYNLTGLWEDGIKIHTIEKELHGVRIILMNTPFGNFVPVHDVEHAICDVIRNRSGIEIQIWQNTLKQHAKCQHKDL